MAESLAKKKLPVDEQGSYWPHLVRMEFLCALFVPRRIDFMGPGWSTRRWKRRRTRRARRIRPKAPWYFLGLQEMLVYFDPWHAGVVLPSLIIVGLMVVPVYDINPKGTATTVSRTEKWRSSLLFSVSHPLG